MMKKIINYINICHIVLNKILYTYPSLVLLYYYNIYGRVITVVPSGHIGPYECTSMCS